MRAEKHLLLDAIKDGIESSNAMIVMRYNGVNPNSADGLRESLHQKGASMLAVPKRLFVKAASDAGISVDREQLDGHIALILAGEDIVGPAKIACEFGESVEVLFGHFEGSLCPGADVKALSKLPGKDEMRAQLLGIFEAPLSGLVGVCEASMTSVLQCMIQHIEKQES